MDQNENFQTHIRSERDFLHDVANQLVIVQGMGGMVEKKIAQIPNVEEKILDRMGKVLKAAAKITELLKDRRSHLISLSDEEG